MNILARRVSAILSATAGAFLCLAVPTKSSAETRTTTVINGVSSNLAGSYTIGYSGPFNTLVITNGGSLKDLDGIIGDLTAARSNSVTVTGAGSVWTNTSSLTIGNNGSWNTLTITNGGRVAGSYAYIGYYGSNNSVVVAGSGTVWTNSNGLLVGNNGLNNELMVINGAKVYSSYGYVGNNYAANNAATISGSNSLWSMLSGNLWVGRGTNNRLTVSDGGTVLANNTYIGGYNYTFNSNSVLVTGNGSVLSNHFSVVIGQDAAYSQLVVSNGGKVFGSDGCVGQAAGGIACLALVTGTDSVFNLNGNLTVGQNSSSNRLIVSAGGTVNNQYGGIATSATSSNNSVLVTDSGSVWSNSFTLRVGDWGLQNSLVISNGGHVINVSAIIGGYTGADGNSVLVTGAGSLWANGGDVTVGSNGSGNNLTISNGGWVTNRWGWIGNNGTSSNNSVLVTGVGSLWNNALNVFVGNSSAFNNLTIASGAQVFDQTGYVGNVAVASNNSVSVTGVGSLWSNACSLYVGYNGSSNNQLSITSAGTVLATNIVVGAKKSSGNNLTVSSGNLYATNTAGTGALDIRYGALALNSGTVVVDRLYATNFASSIININGGSLTTPMLLNAGQFTMTGGTLSVSSAFTNAVGGTFNLSGGNVLVPLQMNNMGTFIQSGGFFDPEVFTNSGSFALSGGINMAEVFLNLLSGTVTQSGGEQDVNYATNFGSWTISGGVANLTNFINNNHATLTVSGGTLNGAVTIGNTGSFNRLTVTNGGIVAGSAGVIGNASLSSNNLVLVTGPGSLWNNTTLDIGVYGSGNQLIVSNGGVSISGDGTIGRMSGANDNTVLVTGSGSLWSNSFPLLVGRNGSYNRLLITCGGVVAGGNYATIGLNPGANNNLVLVSDAGSLWSNVNGLFVGYNGSGNQMLITNGATVANNAGVIGTFSGSNSVLVSGAGSLWRNSGSLCVGNSGPNNQLVINDGGVVESSGASIGKTSSANNNTVLVTGHVSQWFTSPSLDVGISGANNSLTVADGARVVSDGATIGVNASAISNSVVVTNPGSLWQFCSGSLVVGGAGAGNWLTVSDSATVFVSNIIVGVSSTSTGNLITISGGYLFATNTTGNGVMEVRRGTLQINSGTVMADRLYVTNFASSVVNINGGNLTTPMLLNAGQFTMNGGTLNVSGAFTNAAGGTFNLSGGSVLVPLEMNNMGTFIQSGGFFDPEVFTNSGSFVLSGGTNVAGIFLNLAGGIVQQSGGEQDVNVATNFGVWTVADGGLIDIRDRFVVGAGGSLTNRDGGSVRLVSNATVSVSGSFVITNATLEFAGASTGSTPFLPGVTFQNGAGIKWAGYGGSSGDHTITDNLNLDLPSGSGLMRGIVDNASLSIGGGNGLLYVGSNKSASLTLTNGAQVLDNTGYIGFDAASSNNSASVSGSGSLWGNSGNLYVGVSGSDNRLNIANGGRVVAVSSYIGSHMTSSNNTALVTGDGSMWSNSSYLYVGHTGSFNQLTIADGGSVFSAHGSIGAQSNAFYNSVLVAGTDSLWSNSADLSVGALGAFNQLTITNGGRVLSASSSVGAAAFSSNNTALVSGAGSAWNNSSSLSIGGSGSRNQLIISNGGTVISAGSASYIGRFSNSTQNAVLVTGAGSVWGSSSNLQVGAGGSSNQLTIADGGAVFSTNGSVGNDLRSHSNSVLVTGAGSIWSNSQSLAVGGSGYGNQLTIANGGTVFDTIGSIGNGYNAHSNSVLVTGAGSVWSNSGALFVGNDGRSNQLTITDGGAVFNSTGYVGYASSTINSYALVSGVGSVWRNSSYLYLGYYGSHGLLIITNGGTVFDTGYIGSAGSEVLVSGAGSLWNSSSNIIVMAGHGNNLVITDGGQVLSANSYVGYADGNDTNTVLVTGPGSLWSSSGTLHIGYLGSTNVLCITNGGSVQASNVIIGLTASTGNAIKVLGGNLYATNTAGVGALDIRYGALGLNSGTVTVNQIIATNFANSVMNFNGGTLNSGGSTVNNGSVFSVGNGTSAANLHLLGGTHSFANSLFINTNGLLTGTGAITGVITNAGTIAPGNSPGILNVSGDLTLLTNSLLLMELAGTNDGFYDQINVSGALAFDGTLTLSLLDGFTVSAGDRFDLFDFSGSSGSFSLTNLPGLSASMYWDTSALYTSGEIEADWMTGSLQVTLAPVAAVSAGAQWQVDGGTWQNSGDTVPDLVIGEHTLAFKDVEGWIKPTNRVVQIDFGETTVTNLNYELTPVLLAATSCKTHSAAGAINLTLNLNPAVNPTVEPRKGGPAQLLFTFNKEMMAADGTLDASEFTLTNATYVSASILSSNLTLNLTNAVDQSKVTVVLNGLSDLAGNALVGTNAVKIRSLYGDANQSGTVNIADMQVIKFKLASTVSATNFLYDLNLSGAINIADMQVAKSMLSHTVPANSVDTGANSLVTLLDTTLSATADTSASTVTLGEALGAPELVWNTDGDAAWTTTTSLDGSYMGWSGSIGHLNVSWVETTVTGPGTLSFQWKVSSEADADYLTFSMDGEDQPGRISGEVDWQTMTFNIPSGTHRLTWTYAKNRTNAFGLDAGWLRRVLYERSQ